MTYKRRPLLLLLALILLLTTTGCLGTPDVTQPTTAPTTLPTTEPSEPPLTAEALMSQVADAIDGRSPSQMTMDMVFDFEIEMKTNGFRVSVGSSIDMNIDAMFSEDPFSMYMDMNVKTESMGQTQVDRAKAYYLTENGNLVCYMYTVADGSWTYADLGVTPEELNPPEDDQDSLSPPLELSLDEQTQIINNTEVYVLRCTLTSEHLSRFITAQAGSMITPLSDGGETLPEELSAPTVLYIDAATRLPVKIEMDIMGLDAYLNDMLTDSTGTPSIELSMTYGLEDESEDSMAVTVNSLRITMSSLSFEPAQLPELPQEAYAYVEMAAHDPDLGDGSYLIVHTGAAARITPPAGWRVWDTAFNYVYMEHNVLARYTSYNMYSGVTRQQLVNMVLSEFVIPMQESDAYDSHGYGNRIGKFDTIYAKTNYGVTMYYAWAPMGDGWILVTVQDETDGDMDTILTPLLEAVENRDPLY